MSVSLKDFTRRADEAENKLRALESQLNALVAKSLSQSQPQKDEEKKLNEWEVIYWPLKNRGNFVKLVFEEAGVKYKNVDDINDIKAVIRSDKLGKQKSNDGGPFQAMAPPFIRNGDFLLSQSIPCMGYLAQEFGIRPRSNEDHYLAQMIASNCNDLISNFYDNRGKTKDELFAFLNGRFQIWLDIFEKPLKSNKLSFYFDNKCTQADLAVFTALDGVEELFGNDSFDKYVVQTHAYLANYYNKLKQRKSIKQLMKQQEGQYCYHPRYGFHQVRKILRGEEIALTFKSDGIIPDVVDTEPLELLTMEYKLGVVIKLDRMGQALTPRLVQDPPYNMHFKSVDKDKLYTVILTDPDARDRVKHEFREWIHFVKINVNGGDLTNSGDIVIEYVGSGPPQGSGVHRYCWLVYEQSNGRIDVDKCGQERLKSGGGCGAGRPMWKARKFVNDNKLGPLVAGTYYNAEYDDFVPKLYTWLQGKGSYKTGNK